MNITNIFLLRSYCYKHYSNFISGLIITPTDERLFYFNILIERNNLFLMKEKGVIRDPDIAPLGPVVFAFQQWLPRLFGKA
jgi:hypothetical protein